MRRALPFLLACTAILAVCGDPAELTTSTGPGVVRYTLAWSTATAVPHADGGFVFRTSDGTRVWLREGWLVNYSTELIQCDAGQSTGLPAWLVSRAFAGHGDPYDNEARFAGPMAEDITLAGELVWAEAEVPEYEFCQAHYLVARGDAETALPSGAPDMNQRSVVLAGQWERPDGVWAEFEIEIAQATATLVDVAQVDTGVQAVNVRIQRNVGGLLDGVRFDTLDPVLTSRQVLRNLREQTVVMVTALE